MKTLPQKVTYIPFSTLMTYSFFRSFSLSQKNSIMNNTTQLVIHYKITSPQSSYCDQSSINSRKCIPSTCMKQSQCLKGLNSYLSHGCGAREASMVASCTLHTVLRDKIRVVSMCRLGWGQGPCVPLVSTTLTAVTGSREPGWLGSGRGAQLVNRNGRKWMCKG